MNSHALEDALVAAAFALARSLGWRRSQSLGAALGGLAHRLGLRARVARTNLAIAFPEWSGERREQVLRDHYAELGRVALEYARLSDLARAPAGEVVAEIQGLENLERLAESPRGAVMMSGHIGNFELLGACFARLHPLDFVVRPLSNPRVEARIARERERAGVGRLDAALGVRAVYRALAAGRWVAMLADQDARRHGAFVPFFGRLASTALGPARIAVATGVPILMGFATRRPDGRHRMEFLTPFEASAGSPDPALELTRRHVALLEERVRKNPESWFWLHRRWKTRPPGETPA